MGEITRRELSQELQEDLIFSKDNISSLPADIEIEGRTLVNLLGRLGNAIYGQVWDCTQNLTLAYDKDKFVLNQTSKGYMANVIPCKENTYYVLIAEVENSDTAYITTSNITTNSAVTNRNSRKHVLCALNTESFSQMNVALCPDKLNTEVVFRYARVYEISKEEYDAIAAAPHTIEDIEKICALYPYVDDVKCITNPYLECKENLLDANLCIRGGTSVDGSTAPNAESPFIVFRADVDKGDYSFNIEGFDGSKHYIFTQLPDGSNFNVTEYDVQTRATFKKITDSKYPALLLIGSREDNIDNAKQLHQSILTGKVKATLVKGTTPKTHDECNNSRIMFETKLYEGEKITRRNDGVYVKNSEWEEILINPDRMDFVFSKSLPDHKHIWIKKPITAYEDRAESYMVRYDGKILKQVYPGDGRGESYELSSMGVNIDFALPNSITGWGPNYTPTTDEIKAFFLGWRLTPDNGDLLYDDATNVTRKSWVMLWCGLGPKTTPSTGLAPYINDGTTWVTTCPTFMNDRCYTPYKLIYKKKAFTIEEFKTYGSLAVKDGVDINAGSGLALFQKVTGFIDDESKSYIGRVVDNATNVPHRIEKVLKIFDTNNNVLSYTNTGRATSHGFIVGGPEQCTYNTVTSNDFVDYLIYGADTVTSYNYNLVTPKTLKESTAKTVQELSVCQEKLALAEKELEITKNKLAQRSNPNLLINGDFQVWQRGTSFASGTAGYCADRWQRRRVAQTDTKIDKGIRISGTTEGVGICQYVEAKNLLGKVVTLSYKINNISSSVLIRPCLKGWTAITRRKITSEYSGKAESITFRVPDTLPEDILTILIDCTDTSGGSFEVEWVKLELGEYATPLVPRTYAEELAMCQRYFERIGNETSNILSDSFSISPNAIEYMAAISYTRKRIKATTITFQNAANYRVLVKAATGSGTSGQLVTGFRVLGQSENGAAVVITVASPQSTTAHYNGVLQRTDNATAAYIDVDAEIY